MNIYEKLNAVQAKLKATKSQTNDFGKYNYRSCEDILEAVKPLLHIQGLTQVICDSMTEVGGRVYVEAEVTLIDIEKPLDRIVVEAYAREAETKKGMDLAQITGACSSYARKYALSGLYAIDDNKDADTMKPPKEEPKKDSFSDKMRGYATNEGDIYWAIMEANNYKKASDVPVKEQAIILKQLDSELKKGGK